MARCQPPTRRAQRSAVLLIATVALALSPTTTAAARGLLRNTADVHSQADGDKPNWRDLVGSSSPTGTGGWQALLGSSSPTGTGGWKALVGSSAPTEVWSWAADAMEGAIEAKGETVSKQDTPSFRDLVGTASPTADYSLARIIGSASPTSDWRKLIGTSAPTKMWTAAPTEDWHKLLGTSAPTVDWRNLVGTSAPTKLWTGSPTKEWSLIDLVGTSSPSVDWSGWLSDRGDTSAQSVDMQSVTLSPAAVGAQAVEGATVAYDPNSQDNGLGAFFIMMCAIGSALVGGALLYKYNKDHAFTEERTSLISSGSDSSKGSFASEVSDAPAVNAIEASGPDSSRGYQAV